MSSKRLAPLSGIVFVALLVVGFIPVGGETPDVNDSPSKITNFWADHHDKEVVAALLVAIGAIFLALFVATLRDRLRRTDQESGFSSNLILIGGTASVAGFMVAVGFHIALADGGDHHYSPQAMQALNVLDNDDFFAFAVPLGIMMLGVAAATIRAGGALPTWLGWVALVLAIGQFTPVGFLFFGLTGIWIIVASIMLSARADEAAPATT
ncbi:MAG: hypothetical protein ACJ75Z_12490 [Solirubrobacterales bacterium]